MHAETIMTMPVVELVSGGMATPTAAKTVSQAVCQTAPMNKGQRLPYFSTA